MNGCCMVETRLIPNLLEIIQEKHLNFVPDDWGLTLFLSEQNKHLIKQSMFNREVQILILPNEFSIHDYNLLLTSVPFWEKLRYEKVLIFQSDSELLRKGIEEFLQYDFIGAHDPRKGCNGMMNGGLSIRDVMRCRETCTYSTYDGSINEDWWFCKKLSEQNAVLPIEKLDYPFSIELEFILGSLGCHAIDKWLTKEQCEIIRNQYK